MSNLIPPLLSSSPPPIVGPLDEEEDDEFGDFRIASNSYDCDDLSTPPSPQKAPSEPELKNDCPNVNLDINCNNRSQKQTLECSKKEDLVLGENQVNCNDIDEPSLESTEELHTKTDIVEEEKIQPEQNDDDFGDFSASTQENEINLNEINEFGDFEAHFENEVLEKEDESSDFITAQQDQEEEDDDFGDFESPEFGDFSSQVVFDEKNAIEKSAAILKEIFPSNELKIDDFNENEVKKIDTIFDELRDVTESKALIYQWSKSNSQKMFFKALNIDTRNILYGPGWNGSIPKFAGLTPLEPIKPEILTPTPVQNIPSPSNNSSQKMNGDIPTAQFDWSDSGLINPLDYLEQLVASLDIPSTTNPTSNNSSPYSGLLDEWDQWLQSNTTDPPISAKITPPTDIPAGSSNQQQSDTNLFDICAMEKQTQNDGNVTIQNSPKLIPLRETHIFNEQPGWLKPTIVTPDLPRKQLNEELEENDEFDDFQTAEKKIEEPSKTLSLSEFAIKTETSDVVNMSNEQDDEFTEFHSSIPEPEILKPILEPLKPVAQLPPRPLQPTQINWPDPGVTEEDIKNLKLTYSRKVDQMKTEEDEWSDFVSVTNPLKSPERTATPDLPLSVLNLSSVQAPKQPVPVITATGLVQTKLATNMTSVVQTKIEPNLFKAHPSQPSIISSEFAEKCAPSVGEEDDDWSEFLSSAPAQPATNIIMNPAHFYQSKVGSNVSTIPDLDFITPKNRTSSKK